MIFTGYIQSPCRPTGRPDLDEDKGWCSICKTIVSNECGAPRYIGRLHRMFADARRIIHRHVRKDDGVIAS
jgi:hypothetical protein